VKLRTVRDARDTVLGYAFDCPGCGRPHVFWTTGKLTWNYNGSADSPTFHPSLLNQAPDHVDPKQRRCHLTLTAGILRFGDDSSHDLAGQARELPDLPEPPTQSGMD